MIAEQLKKAVLQAAIQGKLTEQLPEDGDARDLLKEIRAEKSSLVKEGKLKKEKPLPEITDDEIPFDIPENWVWVRLGELSKVISKGTTPQEGKHLYLNSGIGFVRAENVGLDGKVNIENIKYVDAITHNNYLHRSILLVHDLLICIAGTLGRSAVVEADQLPLNTNQAVAFVRLINRELISVYYLQKAIASFVLQQLLVKKTKVTAIPNLTLEIIRNCLIPFPPIAEQQRIVVKLHQVLMEIDNLALDENKLDELEKAFPKKMKDAILQAAIQGKLTERLPEDGNAHDLLKDIQKEKARLVKEGKLKKEKPLPEITEDEIPFDIPENWIWARLGDIILSGRSGGTPDTKNSKYYDGQIPFVTIKDMTKAGMYIDKTISTITEQGLQNSSAWLVDPYHILYSMYASIGKVSINRMSLATSQAIFAMKLLDNEIFRHYVYTFLVSMENSIFKLSAGTTQLNINAKIVRELIIPLPPLAEQQRIVEKLDQVLPLLDRLE